VSDVVGSFIYVRLESRDACGRWAEIDVEAVSARIEILSALAPVSQAADLKPSSMR
jgi:hypothetical protein